MIILLTNDDGIDAPGLHALAGAAAGLGQLVVAAPAGPQSGCSHRVTADGPVLVEERRPGWFAVHGTPADCVRLALHSIAPRLDWVISGVNAGGNLGADVYLSGTVAAAREAVLHGKPAIALSHYKRRAVEFDWPQISGWAKPLLADVLGRPWSPGVFWNVNFPHLDSDAPAPEVVDARLDPGPLPISYREQDGAFHYESRYSERHRTPGCDIDVCFGGSVAVTRLNLFD